MTTFELESSYAPAGDQPKAIAEIQQAFAEGDDQITLLGATGTGKTFTMANIIKHVGKPTLVISHNKTLAAQLATEFKYFFPNSAVHYFVSYFDYYQPESYLPAQGLFIEKEATINKEIEMYRLGAMASLLSREDVIIVASASSLYGLGQKENFKNSCVYLQAGRSYDFWDLKRSLLKIQYKPVQSKIEHGMFDIQGERIDVFSSTEKDLFRLHFNEDVLEFIELRDSVTFEYKGKKDHVTIWPANQFLQDTSDLETILLKMDQEKELRVKEFEKNKMFVEAERIKKRVEYDIRMMRETGFVNGIENYSLYFDRRLPGESPNTIFDYFPDDFLLIVDESHMTIPQLQAMPAGDKARKSNLIKYGFRLPSAIDHRPIGFTELENKLWRSNQIPEETNTNLVMSDNTTYQEIQKTLGTYDYTNIKNKKWAKTIFLSATPAPYELNKSQKIVEQIIRPTGLLDPITYIYPKSGEYALLESSLDTLLSKKPHLKEFLDDYEIPGGIKEVFEGEEIDTDEIIKNL